MTLKTLIIVSGLVLVVCVAPLAAQSCTCINKACAYGCGGTAGYACNTAADCSNDDCFCGYYGCYGCSAYSTNGQGCSRRLDCLTTTQCYYGRCTNNNQLCDEDADCYTTCSCTSPGQTCSSGCSVFGTQSQACLYDYDCRISSYVCACTYLGCSEGCNTNNNFLAYNFGTQDATCGSSSDCYCRCINGLCVNGCNSSYGGSYGTAGSSCLTDGDCKVSLTSCECLPMGKCSIGCNVGSTVYGTAGISCSYSYSSGTSNRAACRLTTTTSTTTTTRTTSTTPTTTSTTSTTTTTTTTTSTTTTTTTTTSTTSTTTSTTTTTSPTTTSASTTTSSTTRITTTPASTTTTTVAFSFIGNFSVGSVVDISKLSPAQINALLSDPTQSLVPCLLNCSSNGFCTVNSQGQFVCNCSGNFTGDSCSNDLRACSSMPCLNDGACSEVSNSTDPFTCDCVYPYFGQHCESKINFCLGVSCSGHGECYEVNITSHACKCYSNYEGDTCEKASESLKKTKQVTSAASIIAIMIIISFYIFVLLLDLADWFMNRKVAKRKMIKRKRLITKPVYVPGPDYIA